MPHIGNQCLFDNIRTATAALYPEARIPETPMPRIGTVHFIEAQWKGALCTLEILPTHAGFKWASTEIRIPALMPEPLRLSADEARALIAAIEATLE